ncbi:hypothetical protein BT96DRAFT_925922 [Gymnopus androsaceus JB14]|uniref:Uncharacterized protein n=1 Tax=Gymnopus androsaceus JB14 TaxID=1447944 RepID=A0A6A4GZ88_9AGAR|nr:hypothetical protein BT96DRAFT_925922 [Gymnopus androsaceus JB14]
MRLACCSSSFTARHEQTRRGVGDRVQKSADDWFRSIPRDSVDLNEETTHQTLLQSARQADREYRDTILDYKRNSWFHILSKIRERHRVRIAKRTALQALCNLENFVQTRLQAS